MYKYDIQKVVGQGSYGRALLCQCKMDRKQCIIKQISLNKLSSKDIKQTEQEATLLSRLKHPNIVTFWESFTTNNQLHIVMEFADGGDLDQYLKSYRTKGKGKELPEKQVLHLFVQLCLAIKYIHDRKILHRDLKSQNIFLTSSGLLKLGDFGVSRVLNATTALASTQIGTPYFMSPEIMENHRYNSKTDIWSIGCILYEMMCLKLPFQGNSMRELVTNIVRGTPTPPSQIYSKELRELVRDTLLKNPKTRPGINSILSRDIIQQRIATFLNETKLNREFNHTILHGVDILRGGFNMNDVAMNPVPKPNVAIIPPPKRPVPLPPTPIMVAVPKPVVMMIDNNLRQDELKEQAMEVQNEAKQRQLILQQQQQQQQQERERITAMEIMKRKEKQQQILLENQRNQRIQMEKMKANEKEQRILQIIEREKQNAEQKKVWEKQKQQNEIEVKQRDAVKNQKENELKKQKEIAKKVLEEQKLRYAREKLLIRQKEKLKMIELNEKRKGILKKEIDVNQMRRAKEIIELRKGRDVIKMREENNKKKMEMLRKEKLDKAQLVKQQLLDQHRRMKNVPSKQVQQVEIKFRLKKPVRNNDVITPLKNPFQELLPQKNQPDGPKLNEKDRPVGNPKPSPVVPVESAEPQRKRVANHVINEAEDVLDIVQRMKQNPIYPRMKPSNPQQSDNSPKVQPPKTPPPLRPAVLFERKERKTPVNDLTPWLSQLEGKMSDLQIKVKQMKDKQDKPFNPSPPLLQQDPAPSNGQIKQDNLRRRSDSNITDKLSIVSSSPAQKNLKVLPSEEDTSLLSPKLKELEQRRIHRTEQQEAFHIFLKSKRMGSLKNVNPPTDLDSLPPFEQRAESVASVASYHPKSAMTPNFHQGSKQVEGFQNGKKISRQAVSHDDGLLSRDGQKVKPKERRSAPMVGKELMQPSVEENDDKSVASSRSSFNVKEFRHQKAADREEMKRIIMEKRNEMKKKAVGRDGVEALIVVNEQKMSEEKERWERREMWERRKEGREGKEEREGKVEETENDVASFDDDWDDNEDNNRPDDDEAEGAGDEEGLMDIEDGPKEVVLDEFTAMEYSMLLDQMQSILKLPNAHSTAKLNEMIGKPSEVKELKVEEHIVQESNDELMLSKIKEEVDEDEFEEDEDLRMVQDIDVDAFEVDDSGDEIPADPTDLADHGDNNKSIKKILSAEEAATVSLSQSSRLKLSGPVMYQNLICEMESIIQDENVLVDDEVDQLLVYDKPLEDSLLQDANSDSDDLEDDSVLNEKQQQVEVLKKYLIERLGKKVFQEAYDFLYKIQTKNAVEGSDFELDDDNLLMEVEKIVGVDGLEYLDDIFLLLTIE